MSGVAILDCGAQYAKVIDRRVREMGVHSAILPAGTHASQLDGYDAIIISGGPGSVYEKNAPKIDQDIFDLDKPILGICYGMQIIAQHFEGTVEPKDLKEYGETTIKIRTDNALFNGLDERQEVLMSHGDSVTRLPAGFRQIGHSREIIAAICCEEKRIYGVQFHPEVDLTLNGKDIMKNFLFRVAKLERTHSIEDGIHDAVQEIRDQVKDDNVAVLVSGGVDSAVTAALLSKALHDDQVYAVHVDHGFMRKNESSIVIEALKEQGLKHIEHVCAQERFLNATTDIDGDVTGPLKNIVDPEAKRKIIGDEFMRIADEQLDRIPGKVYLAQGTLRPDLIESASDLVSSTAEMIKTHHNDSNLVREKRKQGMIIETNKDWHKDEVRKVAKQLGLPDEIVHRQPFPGPGLAIRTICATDPWPSKDEDAVRIIAQRYGFESTVLPIRSVGVQGDGRTYAHVALLQGQADWKRLKDAASEIPRLVHSINRVCYLVRGPLQLEFAETLLSQETLDDLREADSIATHAVMKHDVQVAQMPVVLLPLSSGGSRAIVLRPFITNDFMTGRAAMPEEFTQTCLSEIAEKLDRPLLYDLTSKPPGTTEWE